MRNNLDQKDFMTKPITKASKSLLQLLPFQGQ